MRRPEVASMQIEERVRGVVLGRVHAFGGNLVRIGEELQSFSRRPALFAATPVATLTDGSDVELDGFPAEAASSAEVYVAAPDLTPATEVALALEEPQA